ncbi:MAG: hypothetical protein QOE19_1383 [Actinomycetota bacterium]|jgi:hypothetical protein|nr:hypothetical protein [Actinomycetota bacterium]MDQ1665095.1 hypothetical protein [Actinomycetota bacterium]
MQDGPSEESEPLPLTAEQVGEIDAALAEVLTLPAHGEVLPDARGGGRWMRVTWHQEADVVVLSQWREGTCVGTVRLARGDVPLLVQALVEGLADEPESTGRRRRRTTEPDDPPPEPSVGA